MVAATAAVLPAMWLHLPRMKDQEGWFLGMGLSDCIWGNDSTVSHPGAGKKEAESEDRAFIHPVSLSCDPEMWRKSESIGMSQEWGG